MLIVPPAASDPMIEPPSLPTTRPLPSNAKSSLPLKTSSASSGTSGGAGSMSHAGPTPPPPPVPPPVAPLPPPVPPAPPLLEPPPGPVVGDDEPPVELEVSSPQAVSAASG